MWCQVDAILLSYSCNMCLKKILSMQKKIHKIYNSKDLQLEYLIVTHITKCIDDNILETIPNDFQNNIQLNNYFMNFLNHFDFCVFIINMFKKYQYEVVLSEF